MPYIAPNEEAVLHMLAESYQAGLMEENHSIMPQQARPQYERLSNWTRETRFSPLLMPYPSTADVCWALMFKGYSM